MSQRICIKLATTGQTICFDIPIYVLPKWFDPNPPDPIEPDNPFVLRPLPDPWIHGKDINSELSRDLRILATLHAVSATLTPSIRSRVREVLRHQVENISLPEGISVRFESDSGRM